MNMGGYRPPIAEFSSISIAHLQVRERAWQYIHIVLAKSKMYQIQI